MDKGKNISSFRIVSVDYYMSKPLSGLDPTYSEFQGSDVKQVPVIRMFGTESNGDKSCIHIHGVFPYLFIPFNPETETNIDGQIYQISSSLDKAINISLGQSTASTKHIFKIVPVKGIPFYGYHPSEHQFLKIYFYNPFFIKRSSSLLQNGAILGKVFQTYDSHIPYVLKFFIDFNLYGMSFLHVSTNAIKYRRNGKIQSDLINKNIECQSVSKLEFDILGTQILNRLTYEDQQNSEHINPGIASIWHDERVRREKLDSSQITAPEKEILEYRKNVVVTESDLFYREGLKEKLKRIEQNLLYNISNGIHNTTIDSSILQLTQTPSNETINHSNKKFSLKSIIENAVYPAESTQLSSASANFLDASFVDNAYENVKKSFKTINRETIIDEDLILSLSQVRNNNTLNENRKINESFSAEEMEFLEVLRMLEEHENKIDGDSLLGPLTQCSKKLSQQAIAASVVLSQSNKLDESDQNINTNILESFNENCESDSDDDILNNFSIALEQDKLSSDGKSSNGDKTQQNAQRQTPSSDDIWDNSFWNNIEIPQMDGASNLGTPKKQIIRRTRSNAHLGCPSPKSPKSKRTKFAALDVKIVQSPIKCMGNILKDAIQPLQIKQTTTPIKKKNLVEDSPFEKKSCDLKPFKKKTTTSIMSLRKINGASPKANQLSKSSNLRQKLRTNEVTNLIVKSLEESVHLSRELKNLFQSTPPKMRGKSQSPKIKKKSDSIQMSGELKTFRETTPPKNTTIVKPNSIEKLTETNSRNRSTQKPVTPIKNENENSAKIKNFHIHLKPCKVKSPSPKKGKPYPSSPSDVARRYDETNNYFPQPGCSKIVCNILKTPKRRTKPIPVVPQSEEINLHYSMSEKDENENEKEENNENDQYSFYDKTILFNTPEQENSSPLFKSQNSDSIVIHSQKSCDSMDIISVHSSLEINSNERIVITPKFMPPNPVFVIDELHKYDIPEVLAQEPFYSNPKDLGSKKEIGLSVLQVSLKSNYDDVVSLINGLNGINNYRKNQISKMIPNDSNILSVPFKIKDFFSNEKLSIITPIHKPPTKENALDWLIKMETTTTKINENKINLEKDSPISIRREKIKLFLNDENNSSDCDKSDVELTLSPLTPLKKSISQETTPILSKTVNTPISNYGVRRKTRARLSLTKKFNEIKKSNLKNTINSKFNDKSSNREISSDDDDESIELIECGQKSLSQRSNVSNFSDFSINNSEHSNEYVNDLLGLNNNCKKKLPNRMLNFNDKELERSFDISGTTLDNTFGFKMQLENLRTAKSENEFNFLTIISVEIFVKTRLDFKPDPDKDQITAIFYSIQNNVPDDYHIQTKINGLFVLDEKEAQTKRGYKLLQNCGTKLNNLQYVDTEQELFHNLCKLVEECDPDILLGYEIEMDSWGYIISRGYVIEINMPMKLSRIPGIRVDKGKDEEFDMEYNEFSTELRIPGRVLLDVWRLLRHEIALTSYTFENVMYHILHRRYPKHSLRHLTKLWNHSNTKWIVLEYYIDRTYGSLELLEQLDLIDRTCELAKLFGIQFYEVLSRGSQFRVESMMMRMAKPRNFVPVSPSVQLRAHMRAPEYLPLILEPQSRMYLDPVIVLDFQSLYPSIIIAHNYCFSTCLGRVEHLGQTQPFEFGASHLKVSKHMLKKLTKNNLISVSPCGAAFVKSNVREGTLPRMLKEILDTRLMVKQSMKVHKNNHTLQRVLHSRQLGLKLIANVTYGYTAANFSGRMPCVEVGDSVVSKGRETLERAIKLVEANEHWRCKVVYGDTDSMFVLVPGRTRQQAFQIGSEIATAVSDDNPQPIKLKLEKVYQPCILQTKKRYVGFMYENPDQAEPVYEAKGIETVRRDGCPAVGKILEKTIRILFETKDVSLVKKYVCRQFTKILNGKVNIQDLIFAKEFRGIDGYKPGACVPSLELTKRWLQVDKRAAPRRGERVPFIIANGPPGLPLIKLVRSPHEMLADEGLKINAMYYINKIIIPPINRCLLLIGVDANEWTADLPRTTHFLTNVVLNSNTTHIRNSKKSTISQYFSTTACITECGAQTKGGICDACQQNPQTTVAFLHNKIAILDREFVSISKVCGSCCGRFNETDCVSIDCPIVYKLNQTQRKYKQIENIREVLNEYF